MATSTTRMHLVQPAADDAADIAVINGNMTTLDGHCHDGDSSGEKVRAVQSGSGSPQANQVSGGVGHVYVDTSVPTLWIYNGTQWLMAVMVQPALTVVTKTLADSPYTVPGWDYHVDVDASAGAVTVNLPTAVGNTGRLIEVRKTDSSANTVTVDGNGPETINGAATRVIYNQYDSYSFRSDGNRVEIV